MNIFCVYWIICGLISCKAREEGWIWESFCYLHCRHDYLARCRMQNSKNVEDAIIYLLDYTWTDQQLVHFSLGCLSLIINLSCGVRIFNFWCYKMLHFLWLYCIGLSLLRVVLLSVCWFLGAAMSERSHHIIFQRLLRICPVGDLLYVCNEVIKLCLSSFLFIWKSSHLKIYYIKIRVRKIKELKNI